MSNVLNEQTKQQVIALGRLGWSLRRIQKTTGVRRETAAAYLREAGVAVRPPGLWGHRSAIADLPPATATGADAGPPPAKPAIEVTTDFGAELATPPDSCEAHPDTDGTIAAVPAAVATAVVADPAHAKPAIEVTTDFGVAPAAEAAPPPSASASACAVHRDAIELGLSRGRNAMAIWQDLVDTRGFAGGYQSVKRFVRKLLGGPSKEACAVIETAVGEEAQVDYGTGPMVRDPHSGKYRRMRLFVLTLGYSRKSVRLLVFQSSTQTWAELHEQAFRRLGGCTRVVVLDNLGEGVLKPDIYDPTLNPVYADMLRHYGVVAMPCRVADPDRKGKVESGVGHAQKTPLKGMRFESPQEAQAYLDHWEARWADTRIHGTTKRQVAAMFAEERPALLPLPVEPFRYYQYGERTVHLDGCVEVEAAYYGAPPGWIGRRVSVQSDVRHVRLLPTANGLTSMPRPCSSPATPASAPARLRSYKTESNVADVQRRIVRSRGMSRSKFAPHWVRPRVKLSVFAGITISADQPSAVRAVRASQMPSQSRLGSSEPAMRPSTLAPAALTRKK